MNRNDGSAVKDASLTEVAALLRRSQRILAITHISPDGDAIGSLLGFGWLLRAEASSPDRQIVRVCADPVPPQFQFLPGSQTILRDAPQQTWDVVVGLDASDALRLGAAFRPQEYGATPVVIIDHHVTNLRFGTLNLVDTQAAATAQVLVGLADALAVPLSPEASTCLLAGLVTDTLSFRTSNVTAAVMATALRLMQAGARLAEITGRTLNYKPVNTMRLWGLALQAMQLQGHVLWTQVTRAMRAEVGASENGDGGLVGQLISAPEANVAAVFAETTEGKIEIGFRARPGYDVSGLALSLGGGGHPQAAGCTIPGPLAAATARVLPLLQRIAG